MVAWPGIGWLLFELRTQQAVRPLRRFLQKIPPRGMVLGGIFFPLRRLAEPGGTF